MTIIFYQLYEHFNMITGNYVFLTLELKIFSQEYTQKFPFIVYYTRIIFIVVVYIYIRVCFCWCTHICIYSIVILESI